MRDLGVLTVYIDNNDTVNGSGEISVSSCPDTIQVTPMSQGIKIPSNSSHPFYFGLYNSDINPVASLGECKIFLKN